MKTSSAMRASVESAPGRDALDSRAPRRALLDAMQQPLDLLLTLGDELWPSYGGVEPEVVADAEYRAGSRR